jgi:Tfp pilus assembly protein PilN
VIRINLLPPEIIERRRYERFYPYIFVATGLLVAVVLATWGFLQFVSSARTEELQSIEQSAAQLRQQADALAVFELQQQELLVRQNAVLTALSGRVDVGRLCEEMSLILPEEVWLTSLEVVEAGPDSQMKATAFAPRPLGQKMHEGFKSVAATLVRLASLKDLYDVWLGRAAAESYSTWQGETNDTPVPAVRFEFSGRVRVPEPAVPVGQ